MNHSDRAGAESLTAIAEDCLGRSVELRPLGTGQDAETFAVLGAGDPLVLQRRAAPEAVDRQLFVKTRLCPADVRVPGILHVRKSSRGVVVISEMLPGHTLEELNATELQDSLPGTASVMDRIWATDVSCTAGYGPFDGQGRGSHERWRDWLLSEQHELRALGIDGVDETVTLLCGLASNIGEPRHLVHGDFGANNVLWDGRQVAGVLDWENTLLGDPLYDRANIYFWSTWLDCMAALAGYLDEQRPNERQSTECVAYQLRIGLHEVLDFARRGQEDMATWAMARCSEIAGSQQHVDLITTSQRRKRRG